MKHLIISAICLAFIYSCSSMKIESVDFSWPVESILDIDANGVIKDQRFSIIINTKVLFDEERKDNPNIQPKQIHIIRNKNGFYFITADGFKNVYVFKSGMGSLELEKKILISEVGMNKPAFNQRSPNVELLDGNNAPKNLTHEGILGGK